jgi:hypothetical protein
MTGLAPESPEWIPPLKPSWRRSATRSGGCPWATRWTDPTRTSSCCAAPTAFSRRGVRSEGVREAVEEELKRGEASGRAPADAGTSPQTRPARAGSAQAAYDDATRIGPTSRREEEAPTPPYWLVARTGSGGTQILTIGDDIGDDAGKVSTLALFGSEEGAMEFRRRHAKESGWLASPIGIGELLRCFAPPAPKWGAWPWIRRQR